MPHEADQRTEQPTANKREEARAQGQVPRSRDLTVAISLLGGFTAVRYLAPWVCAELGTLMRELLGMVGRGAEIVSLDGLNSLAASVGFGLLRLVMPVVLVVGAVTLAAAVLQSGFVMRWAAVQPDFGRLNPAAGLQKLFTARSAGRGIFAVLKILVVGWLLCGALGSLLQIGAGNPAAAVPRLWSEATGFGLRVGFALLVLAIMDFALQFWLHEKSLRMTPAEVREENHRMEGDTSVKERRRRLWSRTHAGGAGPNVRPVFAVES